MGHPLGALINEAFAGRFPPVDGSVSVFPPVRGGIETVVAFTGHAVIATALARGELLARGADGFGGAVSPSLLLWLAGAGGVVGSHDVVLAARGRGGGTIPIRTDLDDHARVRHARSLREEVTVFGDDRGLVTIGFGLGGVLEISVEVPTERRDAGLGRSLVSDALGVVAPGELVVAEVAPGNAQSLRAFLAAGFTPLASAVHVEVGRRARVGP